MMKFVRSQHWSAWIAGALVVMGCVWYFGWEVASPDCAMPSYQPQPGVVQYSKLLVDYQISSICLRPLNFFGVIAPCALLSALALLASIGVAVLMPIRGGKRCLLTSVLGIAAALMVCGASWQTMLATTGTPMQALQTLQVDGHVYHLVSVTYPGEGMDYSDRVTLYLFRCDASGELCRSDPFYTDYLGGAARYSMSFDEKTGQFVIHASKADNSEVIMEQPVELPSSPAP